MLHTLQRFDKILENEADSGSMMDSGWSWRLQYRGVPPHGFVTSHSWRQHDNIVTRLCEAVNAATALSPTEEEAHEAWRVLVASYGEEYAPETHGRLPKRGWLRMPPNEAVIEYAVAMAWCLRKE